MNETTHDEENASEAEDDTSEENSVYEIESHLVNGEQNEQERKLLITNFEVKVENRKVVGLITYSTDQQIFKFKVNSGFNPELWGVNTDFSSYELKWTSDAILQHMGFYATTENPCAMMRVNHITKSCEYIIIYHDELYIALTTIEEILHITQEKYKIKINPHVYQGSNFPYDPGGAMICSRQYLELHNKYTS